MHVEWITRNLLDLSRLDAGLVELDFADHDVGELITAAAAPLKSLAEEKGITLEINLPYPPLTLNCDAPRLELVLTNLLDNAMKFTPPGGIVSVATKRSLDDNQIWVADTGTGIHPDEIPHIFDRFYRGRQHTEQGSGLGLAIAKSLVEAQGGELLVESAWGEGAKLIMKFPTREHGSESGMESK